MRMRKFDIKIIMNFYQKHRRWILPGILLLLITPFTPWLDLTISNFFYSHGNDPVEHFYSNAFFDFMYDFGFLAGDLTAVFFVFMLALSFFKKFNQWRKPALVMVLTLALGAGAITHALLKDHWGRPRPKQTENFGGEQPFRPYYSPNFFHQPQPSKSFPCGHCSTGFYFFALALVGEKLRSRKIYLTGMILAWTLGIALSLARIAQGAHYFSDTLFSAYIMWCTALTVTWLVYYEDK